MRPEGLTTRIFLDGGDPHETKQIIDILGLLKDKTTGNLSQDEQVLLDSALFNLRMQYVRAMEGKK